MTGGFGDNSNEPLIIFDCDGVLIESEAIYIEVDQRILAEFGWHLERDEIIERFVGKSHEHFVGVVETHLGHALPKDWESSHAHLYREACIQGLLPVDGIVEALDAISMANCIASNGRHETMHFTLGLTGLFDRFDGRIFSASDVPRAKPAPDLFLHAASKLGHHPANCVVVEDSPSGVEAALSAGMKVIAYAAGVTPKERLTGEGVTLIGHMSELPHAINQLLTRNF